MLQRAASNAYSWWRASLIRTKQSKWLDNNLEEMEDTVKKMLKLIEPDADSFAKRAELYFKRRPELISYVEDAYKAYRALAERYDHISGELHKANHTIATSFPERVQYAMLEDDDNLPRAMTPINPSKINKGTVQGLMNKKKESEPSKKKGKKKKGSKAPMDKEQAREEINKLQKRMLVLQTEKEFVKSSYESGIAKYWEIEKRFMEMHEKVRSLEEEFNTSAAIEDNDARAVMAEAVFKSCEKTIVKLQEQRKKAVEQEKVESDRTKALNEKLKALKGGSCQIEMENFDGDTEMSFTTENMEEEFYSLNKTRIELQSIREKIKGYFEVNPESSVMEIAEKIEELANKVITMELSDSSRAMQLKGLNSQNDELEKYIRSLEEDKVSLSNNSDELNKRLKEAEGELSRVQAIKKTIQDDEKDFRENFSNTWQSLNDISQMLQPHTSLNNACIGDASPEEEILTSDTDLQRESIDKEVTEIHDIKEIASEKDDPEKKITSVEEESSEADLSFHLISNEETILDEKEATLKLQQLILSGLEGKEKILLTGFTSILQNYKETKTKLSEVEKKYEDYLEETRALIEELEELKNNITMKDEEIRLLRIPMRQPTKSMKRSSMDTLEGPPVQVLPVEAPPVEVLSAEAPPVEIPPVETPLVEAPPSEAPPFEAPPAEAPPAEAPPAEARPFEAPPAEAPPAEAPPAEAPPAEAPPAEAPTAEAPPAEAPPAEAPPAEAPPAEAPPAEAPPAEAPPAEAPPAEAPPAEAPPAEAPPAEAPPAEAPPAEAPPAEAPPAEAPPAEAPPAEAPPAEAPPAEAPPAEAPPAEAPPAEAPPAEAPPAEAPPAPPAEAPPAEAPPAEAPPAPPAPPAEAPPAEAPPAEAPPAEAPPAEAPPAEAPPAEAPPAEAPPAEAPPAEAPPVEAPPVEIPPVETPPAEAPPFEAPPVKSKPGKKKLERKSNSAMETWTPQDSGTLEKVDSESEPGKKKLERKSNSGMETWTPQDSGTLEKVDIKSEPGKKKLERKSNSGMETWTQDSGTLEKVDSESEPSKKKLERKSNSGMETWTPQDSGKLEKVDSESEPGKKKLERKSNTAMETWTPQDSGTLGKVDSESEPGKKKLDRKLNSAMETWTPEDSGTLGKVDSESEPGKKNLDRKSNSAMETWTTQDSETRENLDSESEPGKKNLERKSNSAMETWTSQDSETLENLDTESAAKKDSSGKLKVKRKPLAERFPKKITPFEEKFRKEIDSLLDDKLEFWLKFCTSFCQIQEFKAKYEDLEAYIKAKDNKSQECTDNVTCDQAGKPESAEITTSLRELKTELHVWLEQGALLKEDLQNRFSSLCDMQEEILSVLNEDSESSEMLINPYKAERFQGEVINMKLENSRVASELQVGLDQVKGLHDEIEEQFRNRCQNFGPFVSKNLPNDCLEPNKANVPLRDFLFGVKPKKTSILARIQHGKLRAGPRKRDF